MRKVPALIATAGLVLATLTACSPGSASADCTAPVSSGDASKLVSVTGDFGSAPTVDFPTPLKTDTTQRSEIIKGDGAPLVEGQKVQVDLSVFNATTGEAIEQSSYDGTSMASFVLNDQTLPGLTDGLLCAEIGSRIAVVASAADTFGPNGGNADIGVGPDDSLVFVLDVVKGYLTRADGADQLPVAGLPAVVLAEDGTPGITIPSAEPPTDLKVAVLKKGDGEEVTDGSTVTVNYTGVLWDTKEVFDSSWAKGSPAAFVAADGSTTEGGVIPGFAKSLIGQTVGSQIIAVIPPDQGYGDQASGSIPAGSTLVFVVDILGVD
ncbi:FKBP-type peptidyl-prolyl cis-trans isomerase [Cryobacterium sp. PAMC25264]|uniref:FKBP-type peptidyl-prolyl cis-trans isomerase n=1 Tax=Cryobacterium sp. PAMC25264 TaxID=2861288 RepID=UPI001C6259D6|nr:FKBP-type peptidyl-prolyl cis-trans isomerase [Cryobacterium sp. PAMC25264]QYF74866.1 FKBP-type peptidyl-prolyl cis-trans isomerase [Cryobacterium sp. PAMC25264]